MVIHKRFIAKKEYSRLDHFLSEMLTEMSRSQASKLILDNHVKLNDKPVTKKNREIKSGDVLDIELIEAEENTTPPSLQLHKLFEDDYLLIIDKPCGVTVHKGAGEKEETILDVFRYYYPQVKEMEELEPERPGIVHRLDKDTSGVMVLAKDIRTMRRLQKQFKRHDVQKTYVALVEGTVRYRNGTIEVPIARCHKNRTRFRAVEENEAEQFPDAREAITDYHVDYQFKDCALLSAAPQTGRTHQLRIHMAFIGNPVLGDPWYGRNNKLKFARLGLHAYCIEFVHPITGFGIRAFSPMPESFRLFIRKKMKE